MAEGGDKPESPAEKMVVNHIMTGGGGVNQVNITNMGRYEKL